MRLSEILKATVIKTVWSQLQRATEKKWNKVLSLGIGPNMYEDLECDKVAKKDQLFINGARITCKPFGKK